IQGKNLSLKTVIHTIREQVGYEVLVPVSALEEIKKISVDAHSMPLEEFLKEVLKDQQLKYRLIGKTIVLERKIMASSGNRHSKRNLVKEEDRFLPQKAITGR